MGLLDTVSEMFEASTRRSPSTSEDGSAGSYWCRECANRVRDVDVDDEGLELDADGTPRCPDCGETMTFERVSGTGCAC